MYILQINGPDTRHKSPTFIQSLRQAHVSVCMCSRGPACWDFHMHFTNLVGSRNLVGGHSWDSRFFCSDACILAWHAFLTQVPKRYNSVHTLYNCKNFITQPFQVSSWIKMHTLLTIPYHISGHIKNYIIRGSDSAPHSHWPKKILSPDWLTEL
jgi:hypothetical protein